MNRRQLLKHLFAAGIGSTTMGSVAGQMKLLNTIAQQSRFDDHKALICVFLYGGNDSYNMLVPTESSEYSTYAAVRQTLAVPQESLLAINTTSALPYSLGLPNYMSPIQSLFSDQEVAWVNNVGPLEDRVTKAQIKAKTAKLPPQLFSHNDQQKLWERGVNNLTDSSGWAGRIADLLSDVNPDSTIPLNISLSGNNILQAGEVQASYGVNADGAEMFAGLDPTKRWDESRISVFDKLLSQETHKIGGAYRNIINRARSNALVVTQALELLPAMSTTFNDNRFENDLAMVTKLIAASESLSMQRQVFFVGLGGWDTHDRQNETHPELLTTLSNGLQNLNRALKELNVNDQVTTFTMSEFGRTLTSNGDGTDHGWGGHQLAMGGAVNGGLFYGAMPSLDLDSNDDYGDGRIIPTTASEQYAATLAKWFGLSDDEVALVFPNLSRFDATDLGFLS